MAKKKASKPKKQGVHLPVGENQPSANEVRPTVGNSPERFCLVGIGASAGGLAALKSFFADVPEGSGLAFVVVVHLSPEHKSHLAELLQPHVKIPVQQVTETVRLEPDHVYVIPPGANLDAVDTHLRLTELEASRQERAPIDHFFRTLAQTHDGQSIGVVLTGTGSDGTLGLREIKEMGGLVVVQDPSDAEYDGMPQSAVATGLVDLVLPLAEIPAALLKFVGTRPRLPKPEEGETLSDDTRRLLQTVFSQIRARTGRDFTAYKRSTILRRITRRMQVNQIEELGAYVELLRASAEEVRTLAEDLLITVTNFFRDAEVFERLEKHVVPALFDRGDPDQPLRVWSVGCATGEEAYSLAILLLEEAARRDAPRPIQVFASDLHERSLHKAREGFYPGDIETDVSPERLERFFEKEDGGYRIRKEVRDLVVFAPHNLLGDPPFSRLDLISCRNLLIYLQRDLQPSVIELFHYALRGEGRLVLGTAETLEASELFELEDKRCCVYRRRNVPAPEPRLPVFPQTPLRLMNDAARSAPPAENVSYGVLHQRLVEQFAPPSLLVSSENKVLHVSASAGRYLEHPGGEMTTGVFKLVREELRLELRAALATAREGGRPTSSKPIHVRFNGHVGRVVVHVQPSQDGLRHALVIFEELEAAAPNAEAPAAVPGDSPAQRKAAPQPGEGSDSQGRPDDGSDAIGESRVHELETELSLSMQRTQSIIEEYETGQEELRASNEELQSANEELRSTLEELETSKEELQSMNEELQTVNQENRHKVDELAQLSSDLQNLLAATDIATLFLDRDLRILRFTPQIAELFNIRLADRGRRLGDFTHRLTHDGLQEDARGVLKTLVPVEREVADDEGRWFLTRLLPYRSDDDRIEGVVITFVDISSRKKYELKLEQAKEYSEQIIQTLPEPLLVLTPELRVRSANEAFYEHFGVARDKTLGRKIYDLGNQQWDIAPLRRLLEEVLPDNHVFHGYEVEHTFEGLGRRVMLLNARRLEDQQLILLGIHDITELSDSARALRESEAEYRALFESAAVGNYEADVATGRFLRVNRRFCELTGYSEEELQTKTFLEVTHPDDRADNSKTVEAFRADPHGAFVIEKRYVRKDGKPVWIHLTARLIEGDGRPRRYFCSVFDISDRRRVEDELKTLNESLELQISKRTEMLSLLQDVTRAANEARTVEEAMRAAMQRLVRYNGWRVGHLWLRAEHDGRELVGSGIWHVTDWPGKSESAWRAFQQQCELGSFPADELPLNETLRSATPCWIDDLNASTDPRRGNAIGAGLEAAVGYPVTIEGDVVAVLEFLADHPTTREERFLEIMPHVGSQLGHVIERKRIDRLVADATEREQRRIGQDIHDGVGQELTGLRYLTKTHQDTLTAAGYEEAEVAGRIMQGLGTVQRQLRTIVRELVPVEVDREGLVSALRSLAQRTTEGYEVACEFECDAPLAVENTLLATHVYRIAQEAVANAVRHSEAAHVLILLESTDGELRLQVLDDGIGMPATPADGFGLRGMAFRAELIGGHLAFEPRPQGGTVVRCWAPHRGHVDGKGYRR
ncbi:Chemotaxis protein methyltransferase [Pseudobythopirellula maris]|uniref:Chemotaxis protein methyltransferase n=1 Tax=Pseudobythopirellula maris TaxID=2527991 RepID=A0A5C5ZSZ7_9BACT|nr:chemotaxis protein CheB [Pseudobythopirellula maris]TWT90346.1 Chemotaxis protein methyltransferase [Pseudobythopirellula maris]